MNSKARPDQSADPTHEARQSWRGPRPPLQAEDVAALMPDNLSPQMVVQELATVFPRSLTGARAVQTLAGAPMLVDVDSMSPRELALHCGDETYDGKPCRRCGETERWTVAHRCVTCYPHRVPRDVTEVSRLHPAVFTPTGLRRRAANINRPLGREVWTWMTLEDPGPLPDWRTSPTFRAVFVKFLEMKERAEEASRRRRERYQNDPEYRASVLERRRAAAARKKAQRRLDSKSD